MELPLDAMRDWFGQWGQGAEPEDADRTRWPVGGADFRETMYGLSWIPAGVEYTTDLAEPRAVRAARDCSSGCCARSTLPRRLRASVGGGDGCGVGCLAALAA